MLDGPPCSLALPPPAAKAKGQFLPPTCVHFRRIIVEGLLKRSMNPAIRCYSTLDRPTLQIVMMTYPH